MRFVNVSGDTQDLPTLDLRVGPGEEFDATGQDAKNLEANPLFKRSDKSSVKTSDSEEK